MDTDYRERGPESCDPLPKTVLKWDPHFWPVEPQPHGWVFLSSFGPWLLPTSSLFRKPLGTQERLGF